MRRKVALIVLAVGAVLVGGKLVGSVDKGPVPLEVHFLVPPGIAAVEVVVSSPAGGSFTHLSQHRHASSGWGGAPVVLQRHFVILRRGSSGRVTATAR